MKKVSHHSKRMRSDRAGSCSRVGYVARRGFREALILALALTLLMTPSVPFGRTHAFADEPTQADIDAVSATLSKAVQNLTDTLIVGDNGQIMRIVEPESTNGGASARSSLPATYVAPHTAVKDQGAYESCWSFASISALECSTLIQQGLTGSTDLTKLYDAPTSPNFAEVPLVYSVFHQRLTESGAFDDTCSYSYPKHGLEGFGTGSSWYAATNVLAQWRGVISDDKAPYISTPFVSSLEQKQADTATMAARARAVDQQSDVHLDSSEHLNDPLPYIDSTQRRYSQKNCDAIKQSVIDNGSHFIYYQAQLAYGYSVDSAEFDEGEKVWRLSFNQEETDLYPLKNSYWLADADARGTTPGHAVTLVGWDDNYSRFNFMRSVPNDGNYDLDIAEKVTIKIGDQEVTCLVPIKDGAWIIKDNYGDKIVLREGEPEKNFGKKGYRWLSYYEKTASSPAVFVPDTQPDGTHTYDVSYQYDESMSMCLSIETPAKEPYTKSSNVFTAKDDQVLRALGVWSPNPGGRVTAFVYTDLADAANPESGKLAATVTATYDAEGFWTLPLTTDIPLNKGEHFSVVLAWITSKGEAAVPLEVAYDGVGEIRKYKGQSFVQNPSTGAWVDVMDANIEVGGVTVGNVAVKAFGVPVASLELKNNVTKAYAGMALTSQDVVASARYGETAATEGDLSFSYTPTGGVRAAGAQTAGLPKEVGTYEVTATLAAKTVGGMDYEPASATATLRIGPAPFSYTIVDRTVKAGDGIAAAQAPAAAQGANGEQVAGTLAWFTDAGRTQALPAGFTFTGEAGSVTALSWIFTPAQGQNNYVSEPAVGTARFTLAAAGGGGEPSSSEDSTPKPLKRTGDATAPLAVVGIALALGALGTATYAARKRRRHS